MPLYHLSAYYSSPDPYRQSFPEFSELLLFKLLCMWFSPSYTYAFPSSRVLVILFLPFRDCHLFIPNLTEPLSFLYNFGDLQLVFMFLILLWIRATETHTPKCYSLISIHSHHPYWVTKLPKWSRIEDVLIAIKGVRKRNTSSTQVNKSTWDGRRKSGKYDPGYFPWRYHWM